MLAGIANAHVDRYKCFRYLYMLNKINADYASLKIPLVETDMPDYYELQVLPPGLMDPLKVVNDLLPENVSVGNISIITNPRIDSINRQAADTGGNDIALVRQEENDDIEIDEVIQPQGIVENDDELHQIQGIDGIEDTGDQRTLIDYEEDNDEANQTISTIPVMNVRIQPTSIQRPPVPIENTVYGNLPENVIPTTESLLISAHGGDIGHPNRIQIMARELQGINDILGRNPSQELEENLSESIVGGVPAQRNANVTNVLRIESKEGDSVPSNEFKQNDKILHQCFPLLFLFGKGVPQVGSVNWKWVKHLLRQYSNKFAINKAFVFLLFNQMQRHETARAVSKKI